MIDLRHGDCMELLPSIPDKSVNLILTDPPYGVSEFKWDSILPMDKMWEQLERVTKPGGAIALFGQEPFSSKLRLSNIKRWRYDWYWDKSWASGYMAAKIVPLKTIEIISVFSDLPATTSHNKNKMRYYPQDTKGKFAGKDKRMNYKKKGEGRHYKKSLCNKYTQTRTGYPKNLIKCKTVGTGALHPTQSRWRCLNI